MKNKVKYDKPTDLKGVEKQEEEKKRHNSSTWAYLFFIVLFGFMSIGFTFLAGIFYVLTIVGVTMGGQLFDISLWILQGCEGEYEFKLENDKVKNIIWLCLPPAWILIPIHYFFYGLFYILFLRKIANYWLRAARAITCPFGVKIEGV